VPEAPGAVLFAQIGQRLPICPVKSESVVGFAADLLPKWADAAAHFGKAVLSQF
jgi:hypothetical protein